VKAEGGYFMRLVDQADFARVMTGSALSNDEIIMGVSKLSNDIKMTACPELDQIVKSCNKPLDEAFPIIEQIFDAIAAKHQIDSAILYWTYLQWLKEN
jgi:hypothetical protein